MALRKSIFFTPNGYDSQASLTNAYVKVETISGGKQNLMVNVGFYNDKTSPMTKAKTNTYEFAPSMDGENFVKQAYEHLKTLPEFYGANDC
jgi:hypothetical protein